MGAAQNVDDEPFDQCQAWWAEQLHFFAYFADVVPRLAAAAANASCVQSSHNIRNSGTTTNATQKADRVARLRRIDAELLGGYLATAEAHIGCATSLRYSADNATRLKV